FRSPGRRSESEHSTSHGATRPLPDYAHTAMTEAVAPAPWTLRGRAYISVLRCPDDLLDTRSFVPASLAGKRSRSPFATMMFVDYSESNVGPYHELLFIPGAFRFADGRLHPSISRIFVSSQSSVENGQRNWGIPKGRADFDVRYEKNAAEVKVA